MEQELVTKNLMTILETVKNNGELLIDANNQDLLTSVTKQEFEKVENTRGKDRAKFVISKTIAYSPSVLEENASMKENFIAGSSKLMAYLEKRQMTPIGELIKELITNEKKKDSSHSDYHYKSGS